MDYSNITGGLNITTQIPLDTKTISVLESKIKLLGLNNNLAYTYYDGLQIFCLDTRKTYEWREVQIGEENTGLVPLDFTYPLSLPETYNIDYSGKTYNFFEIDLTGPQGPIGLTGPAGPQGLPGEDGVSIVEAGQSILVTGDGSALTPYNVSLVNLQKTISDFPHTLSNIDDKHTIFIENGNTDVVINVPNGLLDNFSCVFIQEGNGSVTIQESGTASVIYPNTTLQNVIKGQYYWAMIEKKLTTNTYYLLGSLLPI